MNCHKFAQALILALTAIGFVAFGINFNTLVSASSSGTVAGGDLRTPIPIGGCSDAWDTNFTSNGANGQVNVVVADGAGGYYIGGGFTTIQGVPAAGIARWNGSSWTALGSGLNGSVYAIAVNGNEVYVAGGFSTAGGGPAKNVAKWDGNSWSALGAGLGQGTHFVRSAAVYGGDVYFGGNFSVSDGSPATGIVRWNGSAYSAVPIAAGQVNSLVVNGGSLYVGGNVAPTAGTSIGILKYDGTTWSALGTLANTVVSSIAFSGSDMYIGGGRIVLTGQQDSHVAKFDGANWTRLAYFSNGIINSLAIHDGELYAGGYLPDPPNLFNNLAKWNGSTWVGVGSGIAGGTSLSERVMTLASINNTLFVGGNYTSAGGQGARNIAKYAAGTWTPFYGTGLDSSASAIAVSGSDVYVGGGFVSAGTVTANHIAKWNGVTNTWSALGTGVTAANTSINAIAVAGNKVYAGGTFSTIGGVNASNIAVWNGSTWAALGTGVSSSVSVIIAHGEDIYVGGSFQTAGGLTANRVAKWNGTSWSGLDSGIIPNTVSTMAFMGDDLYVGAGTTTIANPAYFTKYDGNSWTALGADLGDGGVSSIAISGSDVYVSGGFTSINGVAVNGVAKWSGSMWSPLGNGLPNPFGQLGGTRLAISGTNVVATGEFTVASGAPADRIAIWNGTTWSGLSTGLSAGGTALTTAGGDIFVGGGFATAGCRTSPYFARWRQTVWTGATNTDWHTATNWGNGIVPSAGAGVSIGSNDVSISSADVSLSDLVIYGGRTLTIGSGRTLTINGSLNINGGNIAGPGTLIVNGDVRLSNGSVTGLSSFPMNGNLYLSNATIAGTGTVNVSACRTSAIFGGDATSFITSPLSRCVNSAGTYRFPVGSNGVFAPVELSSIAGNGIFTVEPMTGAYAGAATGLPSNRLQRWWNMTNGGIGQADVTFTYSDPEVLGNELRYKVFGISSGTAQLQTTTLNTTTNRATVVGLNAFSAFTLAEGPSTPQLLKGRVRGASGRGAGNVVVTLTDLGGNVQYTRTNPFGYYRFQNVLTWANYTVQVSAKRYAFSSNSQTFEFVENAADVNFTATNH